MSLHPPVLFIGDRPNPRKNLDLNVPFVGTKSYKTLLEWIYRMDIDIGWVRILNAYDITGTEQKSTKFTLLTECANRRGTPFCSKIIVLGQGASDYLINFNNHVELKLEFFKLPHPSGLNRELNDKEKLNNLLTRCKSFIYKENK